MEKIISRNELKQFVPFSMSYVYKLINKGKFPKPIKFGDRRIGWKQSDIAKWQNEKEQKTT